MVKGLFDKKQHTSSQMPVNQTNHYLFIFLFFLTTHKQILSVSVSLCHTKATDKPPATCKGGADKNHCFTT